MAAQDLYPEVIASPQDWSDDSWNTVDTGGGAIEDPGVGDVGDNAWFSEKSGNVTLTANTETFNDLDMGMGGGYAGTVAMAAYDIDADGNVTLHGTFTGDSGAIIYCGGDFSLSASLDFDADIALVMDATTGDKTIYTADVTIGALTVDDGGNTATFTLADALTCAAFVLTDGDFRTGDFDWTVAGITGTGGELAFGDSTVDSSGYDIVLDGITATVGGATITADNFDIGTGGQITSSDDWNLAGNLELDGGTIVGTGDVLTINGNLVYSSGTATAFSVVHSGTTGTIDWNDGDERLLSYTLDTGAEITRAGSAYAAALTMPAGTTLDGASEFYVRYPVGDDFLSCEGTISGGKLRVIITNDKANSNIVNLNGGNLRLISNSSNYALTQSANLACGTLQVEAGSVGDYGTLVISAGLTCGAVTLGHASANTSGVLTLSGGGLATIASVTRGNDANTQNGLNLDAYNILLSGILDGDNQGTNGITVTSVGANIVNSGGSGQIKEVTSDNVIHCWGLIDGGDNGPNVCHESSLGGPAVNVGCGLAMAA